MQAIAAAQITLGVRPGAHASVAQVVFRTSGPVTSVAARDRITATLAGLVRLPRVASVLGPFAAGAVGQVSADGHIAYGLVRFDGSGDAIPDTVVNQVISHAQRAAGPGFAVELGGAPVEKVEKPQFGNSEALGILAAVLILLLADQLTLTPGRPGGASDKRPAALPCTWTALGDCPRRQARPARWLTPERNAI